MGAPLRPGHRRGRAAGPRCRSTPTRSIAKQNLDRYADTGRVDWHYLRNLSADAVPVFEDRSEGEIRCGLPRYWSQDDDWLAWNLGRSRATSVIDRGPASLQAALDTALPTRDDPTDAACPSTP